jgi:hypothetical protein
MNAVLKISSHSGGVEVPFETPAAFSRQPTSSGGQRLVSGVPAGDAGILLALMKEIEAPLFMLYVLHTPRGEAAPGRYQSPAVSAEEARNIVTQFGGFLGADARFDFWVHSPSSKATLVWDRHNQMYCYGPLEKFESALCAMNFAEQALPDMGPHIHHYRSDFDSQAKEILQVVQWSYSPLRPEDEQ